MGLKNQSGQVIVETVLILVVAIGLTMLLFSFLKKQEFVKKLTLSPWAKVSGMVQCGVWTPCGLDAKKPGLHPSNRVVTYKPEGQ